MAKIGRNDPCPCGSKKKYKNCCLGKKPRQKTVLVGSPEPLSGVHYNKEKMEFMGLTADGRTIPIRSFSQRQYTAQSGKEKVISRIQDKVISGSEDLMRFLSEFDEVIAIDTNTKLIHSEKVSVCSLLQGDIKKLEGSDGYEVSGYIYDMVLFRDCPSEIVPERFGWFVFIERICSNPVYRSCKIGLITDHDMENHARYNERILPIMRDFYLPENFTLIYARDAGKESVINIFIRECHKNSTSVHNELDEKGFFQHEGQKIFLSQIPVLKLD